MRPYFGMTKKSDPHWSHTIDHAVSAEIVSWDGGRVGVRYLYSDGAGEAKLVGPTDWAVIRKLMGAGKLFYCSEEARQGMAEIFARGLDR